MYIRYANSIVAQSAVSSFPQGPHAIGRYVCNVL